jgi:hypothetical protein
MYTITDLTVIDIVPRLLLLTVTLRLISLYLYPDIAVIWSLSGCKTRLRGYPYTPSRLSLSSFTGHSMSATTQVLNPSQPAVRTP